MRNILFGIFLLSITFASLAIAQDQRTAGVEKEEDPYQYLKLFGDVFERVKVLYVDDLTDKELIEHAINGMLTGLDPHSAYLNDDGYDNMKVQTRGSFGGLGIEVTMENGFVKVVSPIDDTPAAKAGVEPGDLVVALDGKPVLGLSLSEAVDKMRGKVGTTIELTIRRENVAEPLKIKIKRDIIKIQSVRHRIEGDIGYIRITTFNQQTTPGVEDAIAEIKEELGNDLLGFVIDLRNNPGGLLTEAITVSDAFLEQGEIVSTRGRQDIDTKRDMATDGDLTEGLPLVVLINGGSASAAEIVSGALQDHRRAVVMGTPSFGKGSVQTIIPLPKDGAMRLTTARYYTPSGRSIQAKGIVPDIIVEPARLEALEGGANIKESDLEGALQNGTPSLYSEEDDTEKDENMPELSEEAQDDYQLLRAIDLLRGVALYNNQQPVTVGSAIDNEDGDEERKN
jgi:carboxyl-terminal processing protease